MIGLLFFGAIALWALVAFYLGRKLPVWFKLKPAWALLFMPLVFFAPVMDEVIAWPQMQVLCHAYYKQSDYDYKFAEGVDEKSAAGKTVYYVEKRTNLDIFPPTIVGTRGEYMYVDAATGKPIFLSHGFGVQRGWLGIPAGSSGTAMTAFLKGCSDYDGIAVEKKVRARFEQLDITLIPTP